MKSETHKASRYFGDEPKSIHIQAHENDAATLRPGRPAIEKCCNDALQCVPA